LYYVVAKDESGLTSSPSNVGYFKVPSGIREKIKLSKKVFTDKVVLKWIVNSEKQVERILVYRADNENPLRLYSYSVEGSFTDNKLSIGKEYRYRIKVVYTDGSSSFMSNTIIVKM
jgi:fibronectin type 3 domain-containing protein